jgi:predicted metal-dependent hydrolase
MLGLFRRQEPVPAAKTLELTIAGQRVVVALRRVASARRYTLRVRAAQRDIVISMPARGSIAAARDFAERHRDWIAARLEALSGTIVLADGAMLPLRGVDHRIAHKPGSRGGVVVEPGPVPTIHVAGDPAFLKRRLVDWLKKQARAELDAAVARHTLAIGARHRGVSVKDTRSRWGSCSATGALSFSWRLILAPPFVLNYVAAHEVAHLRELNHSARFWRLCAELCPDQAEAKAWLRAHGAGLHRYT